MSFFGEPFPRQQPEEGDESRQPEPTGPEATRTGPNGEPAGSEVTGTGPNGEPAGGHSTALAALAASGPARRLAGALI